MVTLIKGGTHRMQTKGISAVIAGLFGLALMVISFFLLPAANLLADIGRALLVSAFASLIALTIAPRLVAIVKPKWYFGDINEAPKHLLKLINDKTQIDEMIVVAYCAVVAQSLTKPFADKGIKIKHLKMMLRNPESIMTSINKPDEMPNSPGRIRGRLNDMAVALGNIMDKHLGMNVVEKLHIRLYSSQPVLRCVIVNREYGFVSFYSLRESANDEIDWSGRNNKVLRLSRDSGYEEELLKNILNWVDVMWEHGNIPIEPKELREKIEKLRGVIE